MSIRFICTTGVTKIAPTVLVWCRMNQTSHFLYLSCHVFKVRKENLSHTNIKLHTHLFFHLLWCSANFKRFISQCCLHRVQALDNEPCNKSLQFLPSQTEQGAAEGSTKSRRVAAVRRARCHEEPQQAKHQQPNSRTDGVAPTLHVRNTLLCPLPPSLFTSQAFVTTYKYNSVELKYGEYIKLPNGSKTDACDNEGVVMSAPLLRTLSQNMIRTGIENGAITLVRGCNICVIGWERSEKKPFRTST